MATVRADFAAMNRIKTEMRPIVGRAVVEAANLVAEDAAASIRAGAVSGAGHVPSAPGEPPNADTHFLDRSIHVEEDAGQLSATVHARAEYAPHLEYGTAKMAARPFLRPALIRNRVETEAMIARACQEALRRSGLLARAGAVFDRFFRR